MLKLDLQFSAGSFDLDLQAAIAQPITGLFGPSGAGKTTLLHLIAGLRQPHRGRIDLAGRTLFDHRRRINLPAHRRHVGLVFQDARTFVPYARASSPAPLLVKAPLTPTLWPSSTVDAFLHPRDIALATAPVEFISMQNQFPAQVLNILRLAGRTFTLLNAGFGNSPLLVEITRQAAVDLELQPGQPVWAL